MRLLSRWSLIVVATVFCVMLLGQLYRNQIAVNVEGQPLDATRGFDVCPRCGFHNVLDEHDVARERCRRCGAVMWEKNASGPVDPSDGESDSYDFIQPPTIN